MNLIRYGAPMSMDQARSGQCRMGQALCGFADAMDSLVLVFDAESRIVAFNARARSAQWLRRGRHDRYISRPSARIG